MSFTKAHKLSQTSWLLTLVCLIWLVYSRIFFHMYQFVLFVDIFMLNFTTQKSAQLAAQAAWRHFSIIFISLPAKIMHILIFMLICLNYLELLYLPKFISKAWNLWKTSITRIMCSHSCDAKAWNLSQAGSYSCYFCIFFLLFAKLYLK